MSSQNIVNMDEERLHYNFSQICRFCLSQGGVMTTIFDDGSDTQVSIPSKILACLSIQVYVGDGLPALICQHCLQQLERSYQFRKQCEQSEATLRQYRNKSLNKDGAHQNLGENHIDMLYNQVIHSEGPVSNFHADSNVTQKDVKPLLEQKLGHLYHGAGPFFLRHGDEDLTITVVDPNSVTDESPDDTTEIPVSNGPTKPKGKTFQKGKKILTKLNMVSQSKVSVNKVVKGRPFSCNICLKTFTKKGHLVRHALLHSGRKPHICNYCHKSFTDNSTLVVHVRTHTGERPYACEQCNKTYMSNSDLKKHLAIHSGERRFSCKFCKKTFITRVDLKKHSVVHSGERPFTCHVCNRGFSRSTNLNKHVRIHAGLRPFACDQCDKTFSGKGDLSRHLLVHTGHKPFQCTSCSALFSRKDKLTRHEKTHEKLRNNIESSYYSSEEYSDHQDSNSRLDMEFIKKMILK